MAVEEPVDTLKLEPPDTYRVCQPDPSDPLKVYIGLPLTKTLPGDPHLLLADRAAATLTAVGFSCYNPARETPCGSDHTPEQVYSRNYSAVAESDLILFIRIAPSIGMGEEAQIAANQILPYCYIRPTASQNDLTPLLGGLANVKCAPRHSVSIDQLDDLHQLHDGLHAIVTCPEFRNVYAVRDARRAAYRALRTKSLGQAICELRLSNDCGPDTLSSGYGIVPAAISRLESDPHALAGASLAHVVAVADAVGGRVVVPPSTDGGISITRRDGLPPSISRERAVRSALAATPTKPKLESLTPRFRYT